MSYATKIDDTDWEVPRAVPTPGIEGVASTVSGIGWAALEPTGRSCIFDMKVARLPRATYTTLLLNPLLNRMPVFSAHTQDLGTSASIGITQEQESPFDLILERSKTLALNAIDELIGQLEGFEYSAERLRELTEMAVEEYPETLIPSVVSIAAFRRFIMIYPNLVAPGITLLPSGGLWLSWSQGNASAALCIGRDGQGSFGLLSKEPDKRPLHFNVSGLIEDIAPRIYREDASSMIWNK